MWVSTCPKEKKTVLAELNKGGLLRICSTRPQLNSLLLKLHTTVEELLFETAGRADYAYCLHEQREREQNIHLVIKIPKLTGGKTGKTCCS